MDLRKACVEEMRAASLAFYENLTDDQKNIALAFYKALDTDGNGTVSLSEFWGFASKNGLADHLPLGLFQLLDNDGSGTLDRDECITLLYMILSSRLVICDACRAYQWGIYFLCVDCYDAGSQTYDLCCSCYRKKNFSHEHGSFLDNYALLRRNRTEENPPPPPQPPPARAPPARAPAQPTQRNVRRAAQVLEVVGKMKDTVDFVTNDGAVLVDAVNFAGLFCAIM